MAISVAVVLGWRGVVVVVGLSVLVEVSEGGVCVRQDVFLGLVGFGFGLIAGRYFFLFLLFLGHPDWRLSLLLLWDLLLFLLSDLWLVGKQCQHIRLLFRLSTLLLFPLLLFPLLSLHLSSPLLGLHLLLPSLI